MRYTRLLMAQGELDLGTIMLLDKVQKGQRIDADEAKRLKAAKLVEGRYPAGFQMGFDGTRRAMMRCA